jgi:hypothetical protein
MKAPADRRQVEAFRVYFDIADELAAPGGPVGDGPLSLDDLDAVYTDIARQAAADLGLPWPPDLASAEEYALTHHYALHAEGR